MPTVLFMKKTIIAVSVGILLPFYAAEAKQPILDIKISDKGPVMGKEVFLQEGEKKKDGFLIRTKKLKAGGQSLLIKAEKDGGEISVFGRKVSLKKNGQYQVKWDGEGNKIVTAEVEAEAAKWVAPPDLYSWFSGKSDAENKNNQSEDKDKDAEKKEGEVIRLPRKIVFAPGEDGELNPRPDLGGDNLAVGAGVEDETLDLPPLRDIREKLGDVGRDFTRAPKSRSGGRDLAYAGTGTPRNGADMAITPLGRDGATLSTGDDEYVIQPGDTIDLHFYRVQRVTVDMRGDIRVVSSVGSAESVVRAAGKTPKEVSDSVLGSGLNFQIIPEPALKVNISRFSDRAVVVVGRVNKPGKIPLDDGEVVGISGILKKAGGVAGGNQGAVVYVKRGDKVVKADLGAGDDEALSLFRIMPGDIVTVNKK